VDDEVNPQSDGDGLTVTEAAAQQWSRSGIVDKVTGKDRARHPSFRQVENGHSFGVHCYPTSHAGVA